ncbi:MAG: TIGR03364 family FAD-dependent oxidoreductase [Sutterellaceae bacterium]|nr:TIGR03364 family FAD-dependent oxidoreductase [Burkholderiaceae bacterium]MCX7901600.1 TIGR03364 family FAD-dependent oxidoreductase [Burkholderiaceae bacterium]MDW8430926.1 TIGR03364 family FAD-dependent oxidoreductase [Sutterellaceae bacterium]
MYARDGFDVVIAGAGIVGLACAWAATERGLRVAVCERDPRCVGASVRNFGLVTVTGQRAGDTWRRARYSRDIWAILAPQAGISIEHTGLWVLAREALAWEVLQAFAATEMGTHCALVEPQEAARRAPWLRTAGCAGALYSPHELRIESRQAIPLLSEWLRQVRAVQFFWGEPVLEADARSARTPWRRLAAQQVILCPGADLTGVAAPWLRDLGLQLSQLQMLRVRPRNGLRLGSAVMGDLSLVRYRGYADLPPARALATRLAQTDADSLAHGIHLIAVQSADGSWVVGDSHHQDAMPWPFARQEVDDLILRHLQRTVAVDSLQVLERWTGLYPTGGDADCLLLAPEPGLYVVVVTSGTGASTAFGIADDLFSDRIATTSCVSDTCAPSSSIGPAPSSTSAASPQP